MSIDPRAVVAEGAKLASDVQVGAFAVIAGRARHRYTAVGEVADGGSDAFDSDILVGVNGRWYFRPDFALVAGYEFGKITTVNVGVRYSF